MKKNVLLYTSIFLFIIAVGFFILTMIRYNNNGIDIAMYDNVDELSKLYDEKSICETAIYISSLDIFISLIMLGFLIQRKMNHKEINKRNFVLIIGSFVIILILSISTLILCYTSSLKVANIIETVAILFTIIALSITIVLDMVISRKND